MTILIFTLNDQNISINCSENIEHPDLFIKNDALRNLVFFIHDQSKSQKDLKLLDLFAVFFCSYDEFTKASISRLYARAFITYVAGKELLPLALADILTILMTSFDSSAKPQLSHIMITLLENCRFALITSPLHAQLNHIAPPPAHRLATIDAHKIINSLRNHPVIIGFGKDLPTPALQSQVCITTQAINFITNEFLKFLAAYKTQTQQGRELTTQRGLLNPIEASIPSTPAFRSRPIPTHSSGRWSGFCRYFHAPHGGFETLKNPANRAFVIFTKMHEPNKYFVLLKSNTHIPAETEDSPNTYNPLYSRGGQKQIKLYSILLQFEDTPLTGQIDLSAANKIVTFSKPTENIVDALKDIPPAKFSRHLAEYANFQNNSSITKLKREELKSNAMRLLLTFPSLSSEFLLWDIITFKDVIAPGAVSGLATMSQVNTVPERFLAYQKYSGQQFSTALGTPMRIETQHYFIISFLNDIKNIICQYNRIPYDIKPENICYESSATNPLFWKANLIDFVTGGLSVTFLNWKDNLERSATYQHPVAFFNTIDKTFLDDARAKLNQRILKQAGSVSDIQEFKIILFHFCFEVAVMLFCIMNQDISEYILNILSIHADRFLASSQDFRNSLKRISTKKSREFPFYSLLVNHTYNQNFDLPVSEIITNFFLSIRQELIFIQTQSSLKSLTDKSHFISLAESGNNTLSTQWIKILSDTITKMPASQKPDSTPKIVELTNI